MGNAGSEGLFGLGIEGGILNKAVDKNGKVILLGRRRRRGREKRETGGEGEGEERV